MAGLPFQGFQSERHPQGEEYQASEVDQGRGERVFEKGYNTATELLDRLLLENGTIWR
jgi:NTE family protein